MVRPFLPFCHNSPLVTFVTLSDTLALRYPIPSEFSAMTVVLPVQFSLSTFNFVTDFAATRTELATRNVARLAFYIWWGAICAVLVVYPANAAR
jgi:hypothetical protein